MLFTLGIFLTGTTSAFADTSPTFVMNMIWDSETIFNFHYTIRSQDNSYGGYETSENSSSFINKFNLTSGLEYAVLLHSNGISPYDSIIFEIVECLNNDNSFVFSKKIDERYITFTPQNGDNIVCTFVYVGLEPQLTPESIPPVTISVGVRPSGIEVNEETGTIYVTSGISDGKISVIDGTTNTVTYTIPSGVTPSGIAVNELTNTIYVANFIPSLVSVINGTTNTEITEISIGGRSYTVDVAVNEKTNTIYAVNFRSGTVSVINGTTNTVTDTITVGRYATSIAVNEETNTIYVLTGSTLSVIDGKNNTVTDTIIVRVGSTSISVNETTNTIYVANQIENNVSVFEGNKHAFNYKFLINTHDVGNNPIAIEVNESTNTIYVVNTGDSTVTIITTQ